MEALQIHQQHADRSDFLQSAAAVTIGGNLMGIVGMLVFIPLLSVFYTIFREYVYLHLKKQHIKRVTTTEIEKYTEEDHPIQADNQRED